MSNNPNKRATSYEAPPVQPAPGLSAAQASAQQLVKVTRDEVSLRVPIHIRGDAREVLINEHALALSIERTIAAAGEGGQAAAFPALAKVVAALGRVDGSDPQDIFEAFSALLMDALVARLRAEEAAKQKGASN